MFNDQGYLQINNRDDLVRAILISRQAGAIGQAHLMGALLAGRHCYTSVLPDTSASRFKAFVGATRNKPTTILIGGDGGFDRGPAGWSMSHRAIAWARGVLIHGAGAELEHYEAAVLAAQTCGRVLVIECSTATLAAWTTLVREAQHQPRVLVIYPRGGIHPLPVDRSAMQ